MDWFAKEAERLYELYHRFLGDVLDRERYSGVRPTAFPTARIRGMAILQREEGEEDNSK